MSHSNKNSIIIYTTEYRKYKVRTLSDVEQDYLDSIQILEQNVDRINSLPVSLGRT